LTLSFFLFFFFFFLLRQVVVARAYSTGGDDMLPAPQFDAKWKAFFEDPALTPRDVRRGLCKGSEMKSVFFFFLSLGETEFKEKREKGLPGPHSFFFFLHK
jgi:hypothetical protein